MPCRSDHMEPTALEREAGRLKMLLAEMDGTPLVPDDYKSAYIYNASKESVDATTNALCSRLQVSSDLSVYSLELQMWWRDHQEADRIRLADELQAAKDETERQAAIAKLSPHERRLLGLD